MEGAVAAFFVYVNCNNFFGVALQNGKRYRPGAEAICFSFDGPAGFIC